MERPSHPILAATLDFAMAGLEKARHQIVPSARGDVLEIGVGTGLNFPLYQSAGSTLGHISRCTDFRLTGIEPDHHMLKRAQRRAQALGLEVTLSDHGAEALPFADGRFDTVVCTFVLCTIPDVDKALQEMRRVLKPGGQLLFAEHVKASGPLAAQIQTGIDPVWRHFSGGCHLDRDAVGLIKEAGFDVVDWRGLGRQSWNLFPVVCGAAPHSDH